MFWRDLSAGRHWLSTARLRRTAPATTSFRTWLLSWCSDHAPAAAAR